MPQLSRFGRRFGPWSFCPTYSKLCTNYTDSALFWNFLLQPTLIFHNMGDRIFSGPISLVHRDSNMVGYWRCMKIWFFYGQPWACRLSITIFLKENTGITLFLCRDRRCQHDHHRRVFHKQWKIILYISRRKYKSVRLVLVTNFKAFKIGEEQVFFQSCIFL